ncbi:Nup133p [Sugiyamaella lignohabitans]|uniref:Nup133p n=1 Tax=Sugiyamaella lignohabitans TaxID=796027 RepID=A0A167DX24_9ASCO|nr:Nup133p [Sugiyamaella lignohabitans]ANB13396.1 Nup133p [Sugiyamaella lignohabitans]
MEMFGYDFASVLYQYFVETKQLKSLLTEFPNYHVYLDKFFSTGRHGRISWIRDIEDGDYTKASKTLADVALHSEDLNSNSKLELSIAKLSSLAGNPSRQDDDANDLLTSIEARVEVLSIQESVLEQVEGYANAETGLRYQIHSNDLISGIKDSPAHAEIVKRGLSRVAQKKQLTAEELIDVLTLMDTTTKDSRLNFFRALQVLNVPKAVTRNRTLTEKLIWRRLLLRDDWQQIVDTKLQSDSKVKAISEKTILYQTLKECAIASEQSTGSDVRDKFLSDLSTEIVLNPALLVDSALDTSKLSERFPKLDSLKLNQIESELDADTAALQNLVKNFTLGFWTQGIYSTVQASRSTDRMNVD